jgi:hypothetical protein
MSELFREAVDHFNSRRYFEAETLCNQILTTASLIEQGWAIFGFSFGFCFH